ncbi:glycosyl transferase family A [Chroococcidiopsis sp. CCALA 051]|uniref:glycosyltransferase family 2 protein n=1 Tax=Chroococcidiopsis sp. CCALA 051 TaxID=869949 RepID=UPI000D0D4A93|nr:glycosyltransferase [Chroococcidiopsis sp. CCALA 051]PSM46076.1 glycosyl transferase family A [Chroococcidiopsis sp. CCALA 051]
MPKVSVIIPAYNSIAYLPATLDSVLRQTFTDFEVLIVDDGSSDNTAAWGSQIQDRRIQFITQANQGTCAARNTGIALAQGEYIAFLDADDLWHPTKLAKQVRYLDEHPEVGLVYTWTALIDPEGRPTGRIFASRDRGDVWQQLVQRNITESGSSFMMRRCCFETVGVFDTTLSHVGDWDMCLRIAARYKFGAIEEPLVYYRQYSNSMSKNWQRVEKCFYTVLDKAFQSKLPELQDLKDRCYGLVNLTLAWKCLQTQTKDYKQAIQFRTTAIAYSPQLRYSKEYVRLSVAIAIVRWCGADGYNRLLAIFHALRRRISNLRNRLSLPLSTG